MATPFAFSSARTALDERIGEEELAPFLLGARQGSLQPGYELLDDRPRIPWLLRVEPPKHDLFLLRCVAARKKAPRRKG